MNYNKLIVLLLLFSGFIASCAPTAPDKFWEKKRQDIDLKNTPYTVIKSNAVGTSTGFAMAIGIITIKAPSYVGALEDLYKNAGTDGEGCLLMNVMEEKTSWQFLVFSFPKLKLRADLVEIDKEAMPAEQE